jgi:dGTPase
VLQWEKLFNHARRKDRARSAAAASEMDHDEVRTEFERDYDRILFSAPVRRLGDKTQVFPLEPNDSIRTRLTHSHEVSNLARSIGVKIAFKSTIVPEHLQPERNVPALLAAIGLAHDLGNAPFGHQGEESIRSWFRSNEEKIFPKSMTELSPAMRNDFLKFDGNPQTFRLLSRLQILNDNFGLNLTYGTLAALTKYTVPSDKADKESANASVRKYGFFQSEAEIIEEVRRETGLSEGVRHPLTFIMEACDDMAYSVLDTEDAVKKGLVSFSDVVSYLKHHGKNDASTERVIRKAESKYGEYRCEDLSPPELNDVSMQMFRVYAIGQMVGDVIKAFEERAPKMLECTYMGELMFDSESAKLCECLKRFALEHAFKHKSVLAVELRGHNVLVGLMDLLWEAITEREDTGDVRSKRKTPFARYAYGRISENYRRIFEAASDRPIRYREAQPLTDMISGTADSYAISLYNELKRHHVRAPTKD